MDDGKPKKVLKQYPFKTRPYKHQKKALKQLLKRGWGGALLMQPRTGKTKVLIDYASILYLQGKLSRVLVFAPAGVLSVWEEEIPVHCPVPHRITVWDKEGRKHVELPKFGKNVLDFVIVNYDAASVPGSFRKNKITGQVSWFVTEKVNGRNRNREVFPDPEKYPKPPHYPPLAHKIRSRRGGRFEFKKQIEAWAPHMVVLDESHRIKSPSARKSATIHKFGEIAKFRVIMTGTVVTKKKRIYDVYSQWLFLNPKRFVDQFGMPMNFKEFKEAFSVTTERNGYLQWKRNKNEDILHALMHKDAYSVLREDCFDMPKLTPQIIPVHLEESREAYDAMAEDMVARIETGEITEASIALVQGLRLRQLSNGIARTAPTSENPEGATRIIGYEKLRVIEDRLEDLMEAEEHVIIGASFRPDIQRLEALCQARGWKCFVVMGGVDRKVRQQHRLDFEKYPGGAVFIGNPAAASEGIDLRSAAILIWYSLPQSWVHYEQYMDRNALHAGPRFVEYLLASGVDQLVYDTLMEDGDIGKAMITSPKRLLETD